MPRASWRQHKEVEIAEPIAPEMLIEEIVQGNFRYKRSIALKSVTTTNNYSEATESYVFDARLLKTILIHVINEHTSNAIKFKVLATIDAKTWRTLISGTESEFELDPATTPQKELFFTVAWAFVKIQIKASVSGAQGIVSAFIGGKSP